MRILLFDLDGCLVDSTVPISESLDQALVGRGLEPIAGEFIDRFIGPPMRVTLAGLLRDRDRLDVDVDELIDDYRKHYASASLANAVSYPGVPEMLADLAGDHRIGVVTSKPAIFAAPIVEALGFSRYLEFVEGPDGEAEPKSATLGRAVDRHRAPPGTVMIGDRRHDIEAGRAHDLATVGVTWGFGTRDELEDAGADAIVDKPREIRPVLAGW